MKNSIFKISTAIILCCVLCFGAASSGTGYLQKEPNKTNSVLPVQTNSIINLSNSQQNTNISTIADSYTQQKPADGSTAINPDDVLPTPDGSVNEIPDSGNEQSGVITVPAMLNNIIRDSLPTVITKKAYTFSVEERGAVLLGFNHLTAEEKLCQWYITLYEEYSPDGSGKTTDFRVLYRLAYSKIGEAVATSPVGILPGNYKVIVECVSGYTEDKYDLAIGFAATETYETEPNNSPTRYTNLPLNKTLNGCASILPGDTPDEDYYLFNVTDKGYCVFYFDHEADSQAGNANNIAWRVSITDLAGNEYYYVTSDMKKASINSGVMGLPPGYYMLTVSSHLFSGTTYSVNVSFTADDAIETELNETMENANPIQINTEKIGSLTARNDASDRDFYSFTMEKDGFIVVDFIHEALQKSNDGWRITVMNENGEVAYQTVSDWNESILQSPNIGLTAGNYFIKIDSDNLHHSSIVYRLILLTVESAGWETEPNNTPETADIITLENTVSGTLIESGVDYDKDYFAVDVDESKKLNISFSHITTAENAKEGWIVTLINADGEKIDSITSNWDSGAMTLACEVPAGRYYILVETGLYFNSARYVLTVSGEG